jgi:hypothetical protein
MLNVTNEEMWSNVSKRTDWNVWKYIKNKNEIRDMLLYNGLEDFMRDRNEV